MYVAPVITKNYDLSFKLNVQLGYGHLRRSLFDTSWVKTVANQGSQVFQLVTNTGVSMGKVSSLVINTDQPLNFQFTANSVLHSFTINHLLVLDEDIYSWQVTNTNSTMANVQIVWGTLLTTNASQPLTGFVGSVNGVTPDANGNVVLDVGVQTINELPPSPQGDFQTDEGSF